VSIGTGTYDPSPQLLAAYRNDPEAGVKMNVDDYVLNMKASSAFDQCYTFTYTTERSLPMVQQALAGVRQVRPPAGWGGGGHEPSAKRRRHACSPILCCEDELRLVC
jgi:hypothetical protein